MRSLAAVAATLAALLAGAAAARAQQPVLATNGSSLQAPANLALPGGPNQCLAPAVHRPERREHHLHRHRRGELHVVVDGVRPDRRDHRQHVRPARSGRGHARARAQRPAPAPLAFAIVSSGSGLCCTTQQVSAPVQPAPDQVNEFAVNLPAGSGVGELDGSQFNDILVVVALGPGSLPVNDRGAHGFLFGSPANQAQASFLHPALALGESNTDVGIMDGYEVLLQYDWCGVPMTLGNPRPVAPADPRTACGPAPLGAAATAAAVRRNVAALRLRCLLDAACAGRVQLRPRAAGASAAAARRYGGAEYRIAAGRTKTVKVRLSKAGRRAVRRHASVAVDAVVSAGGSSWTLPLTLKRKR